MKLIIVWQYFQTKRDICKNPFATMNTSLINLFLYLQKMEIKSYFENQGRSCVIEKSFARGK
jgi:hypothetical protein